MGCGLRRGRVEGEGGKEEGEGVVSQEGSLVQLSLWWYGPHFRSASFQQRPNISWAL